MKRYVCQARSRPTTTAETSVSASAVGTLLSDITDVKRIYSHDGCQNMLSWSTEVREWKLGNVLFGGVFVVKKCKFVERILLGKSFDEVHLCIH